MGSRKTHYYLAFDIGATSGRSILGTLKNGKLELKELTRFQNTITRVHDKYYWNLFALYEAMKEGLHAVSSLGIAIDSIGIDTWGVDFAYLGKDGAILSQPRSYRDPYTKGMPEEFFTKISKEEVYQMTGIQIMDFNSIFQLFAAKQEDFSAFDAAKEILFMPDALSYMLTGKKVCEYSIASTSQLLNPKTRKIEPKLLSVLGIEQNFFSPIVMPGQVIGNTTPALSKECGIAETPVVAVAGHDTASAVVAVPATNENFAYLSSGTWSLMGIEVKEPIVNEQTYAMNFTNEGGVDGTIRFLKNITGMWLLEQCRKEWEKQGKNYSYPEIVKLSGSVEGFKHMIDPDDASFANPESMLAAISDFCKNTNQSIPKHDAEFIRCIFDSLALKYKYVFNNMQGMAPFKIEKLHVIGGGAQNKLLNQFTANSIGIPVLAGPGEATAIGNIMIQAKGMEAVDSLQSIRKIVSDSFTPEEFTPADTNSWEEAFNKFKQYIK